MLHGRPDIVGELDLDDRLETRRCETDRRAYDGGFRERRVEAPVSAEPGREIARGRKDAAFFSGHVFTVDDNAFVALHLFLERRVDRIDHDLRLPGRL